MSMRNTVAIYASVFTSALNACDMIKTMMGIAIDIIGVFLDKAWLLKESCDDTL